MGDSPTRPQGRVYGAVLALVALGAVGILAAYGMTWVVVRVPLIAGSGSAARELSLAGRDLFPWAAVSGWVALAGVAGIVATRSWGRRAVGVLLGLAGAAAVVGALIFAIAPASSVDSAVRAQSGSVDGLSSQRSSAWVLGLVAGAIVAAGGIATVAAGARWPVMGARYDRGTPPASTRSAWDLQDMGQDPTDDLVE